VATAGSVARSTQTSPYSVVGGDVSAGVRIGTKALELGVDVGAAGRVDRRSGALGQGLVQIGYAYVPRPFEGRLGWDVVVGGGGGVRPIPPTTRIAWEPAADARASLLLRLTGDGTPWGEDEKQCRLPIYLVLGAQLFTFFPGLRFNDYSNGSP